MSSDLIVVLEEAKKLLARADNDFCWSSWPDAQAAIAELDQFIAALRSDEPIDKLELTVLFAPTGPMQEVSLSSGWTNEFLAIAERFDRAVGER